MSGNRFYYISQGNIAFVKLFKNYFGTDILASIAEFHCEDTECFGTIRM